MSSTPNTECAAIDTCHQDLDVFDLEPQRDRFEQSAFNHGPTRPQRTIEHEANILRRLNRTHEENEERRKIKKDKIECHNRMYGFKTIRYDQRPAIVGDVIEYQNTYYQIVSETKTQWRTVTFKETEHITTDYHDFPYNQWYTTYNLYQLEGKKGPNIAKKQYYNILELKHDKFIIKEKETRSDI
jgi:hypothetical protein